MCLSFIGYEGTQPNVKIQRALIERIVKTHGGLGIGSSPGELYDQKKFDTPYIRDFLLDRGALADVSETSAPWSELRHRLRRASWRRATAPSGELGVRRLPDVPPVAQLPRGRLPVLHLRHRARPGERDSLEEYDTVKSAIQQAFVDYGATLSHHHAVGTEHSPLAGAGHLRARACGWWRRCCTGPTPGRT